jgi:hypothetical protein
MKSPSARSGKAEGHQWNRLVMSFFKPARKQLQSVNERKLKCDMTGVNIDLKSAGRYSMYEIPIKTYSA